MKKYLIFSLGVFFSSTSYATTDCAPLTVLAIQAQEQNVLIQVKGDVRIVWKSLGLYSSASTMAFQSIAQQALATGSVVLLRFPDGHDCNQTSFNEPAVAIRIFK